MNSIAHLYRDFSTITPPPLAQEPEAGSDPAPVNLDVYEQGYDAGWKDALTAQSTEEEKLSAAFVDRLQDMSFTYHEAQIKLAQGLQPLLMRFVSLVMPQAAHHGLGSQLLDQINRLIDRQSENRIELAVAPERQNHLETLLQDRLSLPFAITAEPTLSNAQVYLRVNEAEREINLDAVMQGVETAVEAFYHSVNQESHNG